MRNWLLAVALLLPCSAFAQETADSGDTAWILTSTALVLFMTLPGLSFFYGGLVRSKNVLSVLMQCFAIACGASLIWLIAGYSLAFAEGNSFIGDLSKVFLDGVTKESLSGTIPEPLFFMFQLTFAVITPALMVGGFADRMKFSSVLIFALVWLVLVYLPVCHWVWGGGWLAEMGLLDFAGGTVVHITAGVGTLVAALVIGNSNGYGSASLIPHNLTMTVGGAGMLWVGWFGFNGGSAVAANGDASMAMLVTHTSAAAGSLAWMTLEWVKYGKPSVLGIVTGMVAGLGTITPASGFVSPAAGLVIGLSAGVICFYCTVLIKQKWKIDDSLDVFPVHGVGGILGTLLAGVFCSPDLGLFSGYGFGGDNASIGDQVTVQIIGIVSVFVYTAVVSWILLKVVSVLTKGLRVDTETEHQGLDISSHDERGYNL